MNAKDQYKLLVRIESNLQDAMTAAGQLPGAAPLMEKLKDAARTAFAWRCDQESELPEELHERLF